MPDFSDVNLDRGEAVEEIPTAVNVRCPTCREKAMKVSKDYVAHSGPVTGDGDEWSVCETDGALYYHPQ